MDDFEKLLDKNRKDASIIVMLQGFKYNENIAKIIDKKADKDIALLHELNQKDYLKKNTLTIGDIKQYGVDMKDSFSKSKGNLFKNTATAINYGIIKPIKGIKNLLSNPIENDIESINESRKSLRELKKYYENIEKVARANKDDEIVDMSIALQSKINVLDSRLSIKEDDAMLKKIYKENNISTKNIKDNKVVNNKKNPSKNINEDKKNTSETKSTKDINVTKNNNSKNDAVKTSINKNPSKNINEDKKNTSETKSTKDINVSKGNQTRYNSTVVKTGGLSVAGSLLAGGIGSIIPTVVRMLLSNPVFLTAVVTGVAGLTRAVQLSRDIPSTLTMDADFNDHIDEVQASYKEAGYEGKTPVDEYNDKIQAEQNLKELKDYIIFRNNSDRDWGKVNTDLRSSFEKFAKYYFEQTKTKIIVTSAYRSSEKQQAMLDLWNNNEAEAKKQGIVYKPASAAGPHTQGNAIDISQQSLIAEIDTMLNIYGLHRPLPSDPVHITLKKITESSKESNTKVNEIKNMYMADNYYKRISSTLKLGAKEEYKIKERPSNPFIIDKNKKELEGESSINNESNKNIKTKNQESMQTKDENVVNTNTTSINDENNIVPTPQTKEENIVNNNVTNNTNIDNNNEYKVKPTNIASGENNTEALTEVPKPNSKNENNIVPTPQTKEENIVNNNVTNNTNASANTDNQLSSDINTDNTNNDNSNLQLKENSITVFKYNNDETKKLHTR